VTKLLTKLSLEGKAVPVQAWTGPEGPRRQRLPEFQDNRHMSVARFSALRTGRLYPRGDIPGTHLETESIPETQCGREE